MHEQPDILTTIRQLTLSDLDQRLAEIGAELAALSTLRRSLVARDKAKRRAARRATPEGVRHAKT